MKRGKSRLTTFASVPIQIMAEMVRITWYVEKIFITETTTTVNTIPATVVTSTTEGKQLSWQFVSHKCLSKVNLYKAFHTDLLYVDGAW